MENLRLAKVIQVHPEKNRVDIIMMDDGTEIAGVQSMMHVASSRTGGSGLPEPSLAGNRDPSFSGDLDMVAVIGYLAGGPIVLGFLPARSTQMLFKDKNRMIYRHASDLYFSVDGAGNAELYHPSGTYFRIGESSAHEDLTGKDFNKKWKIDRNTNKTPYFKMAVANGGAEQASIDMTPAGDINIVAKGNVTQTITGTMTADVTGDTTITTPNATVNGHVTTNGNVDLDGGGGRLVTTKHVCAFTGASHPDGSASCAAKP